MVFELCSSSNQSFAVLKKKSEKYNVHYVTDGSLFKDRAAGHDVPKVQNFKNLSFKL